MTVSSFVDEVCLFLVPFVINAAVERKHKPNYLYVTIHFSILFYNLVKEAIMQFGQNKMDDCMATCRDVCARATRYNSGNWPFLQTKAFYIMSAVYRQAKDFDLANEYMEYSTEVR